MRRFVITSMVAVLAGLLALLGASPAQAYPEPQIRIEFGGDIVIGGEGFTVTFSANVDCLWTATLEDQRRAGEGRSFTTRFEAPEVTRVTRFPLRVSCSYVDSSSSRSARRTELSARSAAIAAPAATRSTVSRTFNVTVYPPRGQGGPTPGAGTSPGSLLADTGGPSLWWTVAGGALVLAGAATLTARRRSRH